MIKFFRKIRQSLLSENKFRKYLLYAIGEIILVVIGILIALQINNWNQDRLTQIQIKKGLINLSEAINKDYELLKQIGQINDFRYVSIYLVLKWTNERNIAPWREADTLPLMLSSKTIWDKALPETYNLEFFRKTILYIERPRVMIVQSYAFEELKNTGLYSQLNNQQLKNLLNEYYTGLEWFFGGDLNSNNDAISYLSHYIRDNYNLTISDIPIMNEPMEFIKNEPGIIVRLKEVLGGAYWRKYGANTSKLRAEVLLDEIVKEINNY